MTSMIHHSPLRSRLALSTALAGSLVALPGTAWAQNTPANPTVVIQQGIPPITFVPTGATPAGSLNGSATNLDVNLQNSVSSVIDWTSFDISGLGTVNFTSNLTPPVAVLNRVTAGGSSSIAGNLTSDPNVAVWIYNPNGVLFSSTANINVGSLVVTALDIDPLAFVAGGLTGIYDLDAATVANAHIQVNGATITTQNGNRGLVLVAPRITSSGTLDAPGQDVALISATDVTLNYGLIAGSPLGVTIAEGTTVVAAQTVSGTVSGRNVLFAVAAQDLTALLLDVDAVVTATTAAASGNGIVLSGNVYGAGTGLTDAGGSTGGTVNVTANGTLTATGGNGNIRIASSGDIAGTVAATASQGFLASGQAVSLGAIAAGDLVEIDANGVFTATSLAGDDGVAIDQNGAFASTVTGAIESSAGGFTADGGTDMTFGSIDVNGAVNIGGSTASDTLTIDGTTDAGGSLSVETTGAQTWTGAVTAAGAVDIANTASGDIAFTAGLQSTGSSVTVDAVGALTAGGTISGSGAVALEGASIAIADATSVTGTLALNAVGGTLVATNLSAVDDDIDVTAAGAVTINGDVTAGGNLAITGTAVTLGNAAADEFVADGTVVIEATTGSVGGSAGLIRSAANGGVGDFLIIDAATTIALGATALNAGVADVGLNAGAGSTIATGDIAAARLGDANAGNTGVNATFNHDADTEFGNVTITADALDIELTAGNLTLGDVSGASSVTLDANAGTLNAGDVTGDDAVSLVGTSVTANDLESINQGVAVNATTGDASVNAITSADDASVSAVGMASVSGTVDAGGDYLVTGFDVELGVDADGEVQDASGDIVITATGGTITGGQNLSLRAVGTGDLTLTTGAAATGGDIVFADNSLVQGGVSGTQRDVIVTSRDASNLVTLGDVSARGLRGSVGAGAVANGLTRSSSIVVSDVALVNTLALTSTAGDVTTGTISVTGANQGIVLSAANGTLSAPGSLSASGDIALTSDTALTFANITSTAGSVTATSNSGTLTTGIVAGQTGVTLTADDDVTVAAANSAGGAANLTSISGDVTLGSSTALTTIDISALAGNAAVTGTVSAGTDYAVTAESIALGVDAGPETQTAGGQVLLTATSGSITGGQNLALRSGTGDITLDAQGSILFDATSLLRGGATGVERDILVRSATAAGVVTLGDVTARGLLGAVGAAAFSNGIVRDSNITADDVTLVNALTLISNLGDVAVGGVSVTGVGQGITLQAATGALTAPGSLDASGNIVLSAASALNFGGITSTAGSVFATSTGGALTTGAVSGQTGIVLSAAGTLTATSAASAGGTTQLVSTGANVVAGDLGGTAVTVSALTSAAVTGDVTATAGDYAVTGGSVSLGVDGNDEIQQATGAVTITSTGGAITGGQGLTLRGNADDALQDPTRFILGAGASLAFDATSLVQGGADRSSIVRVDYVDAAPSIVFGDVSGSQFVSFNGTTTTIGALDAGAGNVTTGDLDFRNAAGIRTTGTLTTGAINGTNGVSMFSGGALDIGGPVTSLFDIRLSSTGSSVTLADSVTTTGGLVSLSAASALTGSTVSAVTDLSATGGSVDFDSLTATTGPIEAIATAGDLSIGTVNGGGAVTLATTGGGGDVRVDSATAAGLLTVNSNDAVRGDSLARATLTSTADSVSVTAAGAATLDTVTANQDIGIQAASIDALTLNALNGSLTLNATATGLTLGSVDGETGVNLTALGDLSVDSATSGGGAIGLTSTNGNTTLRTATAAGDITVNAALAATVDGDITAGGNYGVTGNIVNLGVDADSENQQAVGAVTLTATGGNIVGGEGLTLTVDSNDTGAEQLTFDVGTGDIAFDPTSTIIGGSARNSIIRVDYTGTGPDVTFGSVSGFQFRSFDGTNLFNDLLLTGGSVTTGDLDFANSIGIQAGGPITLDEVNSDGTVLLVGPAGITINGAVDAGSFTSSGSTLTLLDSLTTTGPIQIGMTGAVSGTDAEGSLVFITGDSVSFDTITATAGIVDLAAITGDITATTITAAGSAEIEATGASGNVRVDSVVAGGGIDIVAGDGVGGRTPGTRIDIDSTGGAVDIVSGGTASIDTGTGAIGFAVDAGTIDAIALDSGSGALALTAGAGGITLATGEGATAALSTTGVATVSGSLATTGDASVTGASAALAPIASSAGSVSVTTTGGDYTAFGGGRADITAANDITLSIAGNALVGTLDAGDATTVGATSIDATLIDAGGAASVTTSGVATIGTIAGSSIAVTGGSVGIGSAASGGLLDLSATAGALSLTSGSATGLADIDATGLVTIGTLGAASADIDGGAVTVTTSVITTGTLDMTATAGDLDIELADSGGQMTLAASNDILFETLDSGAGASLTAGGDILGTTLSAVGAVSTNAGGLTDIANLNSGAIAITSGVIDIAALSTTGSLALTSTTGDLTLGTGNAATATFLSAGDLTIGNALTVGGLADLDAVGAVQIGTLTAGSAMIDAGTTLNATLLDVTGALTTNSAGATTIATIDAGSADVTGQSVDVTTAATTGALALTSTGGLLRLGTGTAGGTATLDATGPLTITTSLISTGNASATATGAANIGIIQSTGGSVDVAAASAVIDQARAATTLDLDATAGDLALTTGVSGGSATLDASGAIDLDSLNSGAGVALVAGGEIDADTIAATGAATTVSGGATIIGTVTGGSIASNAAGLDIGTATSGSTLALTSTAGLTLGTGGAVTTATLSSTGDTGIGTLTSGGATSVNAGGSIVATTIDADGAATTVSGGATTIGALSGASIAATGASVALTMATAGTTLAVTATTGDAAVNGSAGTTATVSAVNGDVVVGTGLTSGGATTITAGSDARLANVTTTNGALSVTATTGQVSGATAGTRGNLIAGGAGNALSVTAGDTVLLGTANGAGGVTIAGDAIDATTIAASGGAITLNATAGAIALGTGSASGAASLTASGAVGVGTLSAASIAIQGASAATTGLTSTGATTVTTTGAAALGTTNAGGAVSVTANGITAGATNAGTTLSLTSGAGITLASGSAAGNATFDAVGTAALGAVTAGAGSTLSVRASDAAITGIQRAGTITFINRTPTTTAMRLGDGTATGGFALGNTEFGLLEANTLNLDGGNGAVQIGTLAFDADAGRTATNIMTTGQMEIVGTVSATGANRLFRFGGDATAPAMASQIRIVSTADAGGRLLFGTSNVELRGQRIVMGLASQFVDTILGSTPLSAAQVAAQFISNPNSALYNTAISGQFYTAKDTLVANSLTVRFGDYALFQNSEVAGFTGGAVLGGTPATPVTPALTIDGSNSAGADGFALFGTINGITGSATSLLGPSVIVVNMVDLPNARVNGCLIGSGAGCLTSVVSQPTLNVFDSSRLDVLRAADDLSLPFDPVVGTNNEALFSGVAAIDVPVTGDECEENPDAAACRATEEEIVP